MFELVYIIVGTIAAIIGATVGLRTLLKHPHITFSLQKVDFCLCSRGCEERISLLLALVVNKKRRFFGEIAKKVSASVIFRAPSDDEWPGLNASAGLPWMRPFGSRQKIAEQLKSEEDIQQALENHLFDRTERDIPQGRGECLIVAYGVEKTNKLYLASNPPIEIPLPHTVKAPSKPKIVLTGCFFRLEIAGENLPSTLSEGSIILGNSWNNWSVPSKVITIRTPSKLRNLLLRLGICREVKVLKPINEN